MMIVAQKIATIKAIHSLIWLVMASAVFYILYSGITGNITKLTFAFIGLIIFEILVLSINGWACPLTHVAQRVKRDWKDGDDIYLPVWLAVRNKTIFGTLFFVGFVLVVVRTVGLVV